MPSIFRNILKIFFPEAVRIRLNSELFSILKFIMFVSKEILAGSRILDAGAGSCPYKKFFSHAQYESTDFENIFEASSKGVHDYICSLDEIPRPDNYYDAILNTQVLEHVENPQKVINEFHRVLKTGGKLFLTAPQGWGIHGAPYHFFNFTKYGLELLFKKAGFKIIFIKPRGGIFWYLSNRIKTLPSYIFNQYSGKQVLSGKFKKYLVLILLFPFYILSLLICGFILPLLFFYLDPLDKLQDYTLGYACYCLKETIN